MNINHNKSLFSLQNSLTPKLLFEFKTGTLLTLWSLLMQIKPFSLNLIKLLHFRDATHVRHLDDGVF